jgi:hypothetical protein
MFNAIYYVLAAVFASWFCVLKNLTSRIGHIIYYILAAVFASCFTSYLNFGSCERPPKGGPL